MASAPDLRRIMSQNSSTRAYLEHSKEEEEKVLQTFLNITKEIFHIEEHQIHLCHLQPECHTIHLHAHNILLLTGTLYSDPFFL